MVSLNKANKLRNALEALVVIAPVALVVRSDDDIEMIRSSHKNTVSEYQRYIERITEHHSMIHRLRSLIDEANHKFGVTELIGKIALLEKLIKTYSVELTGDPNNRYRTPNIGSTIEDIQKDQEHAERVKAANGNISDPRKITVVLDKESIVAPILKKLKLEVEQLKEDRNAKNHRTNIELPEDLVNYLRVNSLI